ncbi:MAG TPA: tetratricopeptide repeat protein [Nitrospirota bacterium]|nr:tetratricopeptide repeat protein [Nitrospirota bacterium]
MRIFFRIFSLTLMLILANMHQAKAIESTGPPTPLERAKALIAENKPAMTIDALSAYHPSHEELSDYHYVYAQALAALKHRYESIEHYRLAYVYARSPVDKERMLFERAKVYADMGYSSEAADCFDVLLKQFPQSSLAERAHLGIAEARYQLGEFREALVHYEKAGTSHQTLIKRAITLQALNRNEEAHKLFHDMIEQDPELVRSSPETMYNLGESYRRIGKLKDARIFFEFVKDPAFNYWAAQGLGLIALTEKRFDDAVTAFTRATKSPDRSLKREAAMNLADAYLQMGKKEEAQAALLEIKKNYPYGKQYDAALILLARLYRTQEKFNESLSLLRELILRRNPVSSALDEVESVFNEAKDRDPNKFIKLWTMAGRWLLDPSRARSIIKIAPHLRNAGKPFLDVCSWLIKYGPPDVQSEAWLLLANFYADLGDAASARDYMKHANPATGGDEVLRIQAKIALASKECRTAAESIMKIQDVNENDVLLLLDSMKLLTNIKKEKAFCERAIHNKTVSPTTAVKFADILYAEGNRQEALAYYRVAVAASPEKEPKNGRTAADADWALYRIATMTKGEDAEQSLKAIQEENNEIGRFAAAELKGVQLRRRTE